MSKRPILSRQRRQRRTAFVSALVAGLAAVFAGGGAALAETAVRDLGRTLTHDGLERSYLVHLPAGPAVRDRSQPAPLVIALHSGGGRARAFAEFTGFNRL